MCTFLISFIACDDPDGKVPPDTAILTHDSSTETTDSGEDTSTTPLPESLWFSTQQDADVLLSGIDFNNTGGSLTFNFPSALGAHTYTDSEGTKTRIAVPDRGNNRVLIWHDIPREGEEPDIIIGQTDGIQNEPGTGMHQLYWPVSAALAEDRLVVADAENNRVLIWNSIPTEHGQAADISLGCPDRTNIHQCLKWPWAVWTDGSRLIATSTNETRSVLIWNTMPIEDNQEANISLQASDGTNNHFGTPRTIITDGVNYLAIGDHNAQDEAAEMGTFIWNGFPSTDNEPYTKFIHEPGRTSGLLWGGSMPVDGPVIGLGSRMHIWDSLNSFTLNDDSDLVLGTSWQYDMPYVTDSGYAISGGDAAGLAYTGNELLVSASNQNSVLLYNTLPDAASTLPDLAIGAPDINTNAFATHGMINNPMPATNGTTLIATSAIERQIYVWDEIPTESGTLADSIFLLGGSLDITPNDNWLWDTTFVIGGENKVAVWNDIPESETPDHLFVNNIGSVELNSVMGTVYNGSHLFIAVDRPEPRLFVFEGIPESTDEPVVNISIERGGRLSIDSTYLSLCNYDPNQILVYALTDLLSGIDSPTTINPGSSGSSDEQYGFELPHDALIANGHLFVADTGKDRVLGWRDLNDALEGADPDIVLGQPDLYTETIEGHTIYSRVKDPGALAYDSTNGILWIGGYKFSNKLTGFYAIPIDDE